LSAIRAGEFGQSNILMSLRESEDGHDVLPRFFVLSGSKQFHHA